MTYNDEQELPWIDRNKTPDIKCAVPDVTERNTNFTK